MLSEESKFHFKKWWCFVCDSEKQSLSRSSKRPELVEMGFDGLAVFVSLTLVVSKYYYTEGKYLSESEVSCIKGEVACLSFRRNKKTNRNVLDFK